MADSCTTLSDQEPITRSMELTRIPVTAFSQCIFTTHFANQIPAGTQVNNHKHRFLTDVITSPED